jgi:hypothetical protein
MKKISFIMAAFLAASIMFLSSCTKDTTPPSINFKGGAGYTSTDVTIDAGSIIKIGINATSGSSKLERFTLVATYNNVPTTIVDTTFSSDTYNRDFELTIFDLGATRLTCTITDKDLETADVSFTVTTQEAINQYTAVLLGGQLNPDLGSFYSSADNSVMNLGTARNNPEKADMVYYYGTTNQASIVAVSDAQLDAVPTFAECSGWTVKNDTKFKLTTGVDWASITTGADITANATNMTVTHINQLAVGDIVAFQTATTSSNPGKKGLYKVLEINGTTGADRSIKIEVKIMK